jgi:hypothetical protein
MKMTTNRLSDRDLREIRRFAIKLLRARGKKGIVFPKRLQRLIEGRGAVVLREELVVNRECQRVGLAGLRRMKLV